MRTSDFILELKKNQIELEVFDGVLKVTAPKEGNVLTGEVRERISARKGEIINFLLRLHGAAAILNIPPIEISQDYLLSRSQKRFWILHELKDGSEAYNMSRSLLFEGDLDINAFRRSLRYVINRHESLRTVFREDHAGEVRQSILEESIMPFHTEYLDISQGPDVDVVLKKIAEYEQSFPFDLRKEPPLRVKLVKVKDHFHAFFYTMYHIISDGWSMEVMASEVVKAYNSFREGTTPSFPPLKFQYKEYAAWQEKNLDAGVLHDHESYWLDQLSGELPVLDLPWAKKRPLIKTARGASFSRNIPTELVEALTALCKKEGVTLVAGILAGLKTLFYRYTGKGDIIVGMPIAGREHEEFEDQIGLYLNTVALRTRFNGIDSFEDVLRKIGQVMDGAYSHQSYPFDLLIEKLRLDRDPGRSPLFDVLVVSQIGENVGSGEKGQRLEGLQIKTLQGAETATSQYDLLFNFTTSTENIHLSLTYNPDLYSLEHIEILYFHLERLVTAAIKEPGVSIWKLEYLSGEEKNALIALEGRTVNYPGSMTIIGLFESQVASVPDNIAVVCGDIEWTYAELNERSNEIAHYLLRTYSVQSDQMVGIMIERSSDMIAAILGVLKSGAAYVPIDPSSPDERIDHILRDSKSMAVIVDRSYSNRMIGGTPRILPDEIRNTPKHNPSVIIWPSNVAYIIYTSGTTGVPKGVMIEHRNVVRLLFNDKNLFDFSEMDVWTMFHSCNFDFSVWEMYGALLYGARLIIVHKDISVNTIRFWELIREHNVTVLNQTPSAFYNLTATAVDYANDIHDLRYVIFGGEALTPTKLKEWKDAYPFVRLINMYGITETTVHVTYKEIGGPDICSGISNIGRPIPTLQIDILDSYQQLLPAGVPGEICISGAGLGRGYINNAVLTAEKFVSHPFRDGERMYRSGDLGRWMSGGDLEYMGRIDNQVKIRGYRIEPEEIEGVLLRQEEIKEALVVAREGKENGDKYLVAYIVSKGTVDMAKVRGYLNTKLPGYMIPAYLVELGSFPLTSNGKIDRKALPDPERADMERGKEYVAPRTETEKKLVSIWEEVLGRAPIGIYDNFFELGGHSLKAMQVVSRIHKEMNVKADLRLFFISPVLKDLAFSVVSSSREIFSGIEPAARQELYELSHAQKGIWTLAQFEEGKVAYNISSMYQIEGDLEQESLANSLDALIRRHESIRTVFVEVDGAPKQKICNADQFRAVLMYDDLRNSHDREDKVKTIQKQEVSRSFDLNTGPLLNARLLHVEERKFVFLFTIHHLVCDGWSLELLVEELIVLYNGLRKADTKPLPPLTLQYKDYSEWEKTRLYPERLSESKQFWFQHFEGGISTVKLQAGKLATIVRGYKGATHTFKLDSDLKEGLERLLKENNVTLYVLMLSLFNVFLSKLSKEEEISILCAHAGRDHLDLERIIGIFVRTFGFKTFPQGHKQFSIFLAEVQDRYLEISRHDHYPFEMVLEGLV